MEFNEREKKKKKSCPKVVAAGTGSADRIRGVGTGLEAIFITRQQRHWRTGIFWRCQRRNEKDSLLGPGVYAAWA